MRAALAPCAAAARKAQAPCTAAKRTRSAAASRTRQARIFVESRKSETRSATARKAAENAEERFTEARQGGSAEDEGLHAFVIRRHRRTLLARVKEAKRRGKHIRIDEALAELLESDPEIATAYHTWIEKKHAGHGPTLRQHLKDLERENRSLLGLLEKKNRETEKKSPPPPDDDEIPF